MSEATHTVIDIGRQQIGGVYAKALLGAVESAGGVDGVLDELGGLVTDVFDKLPRFQSVLESPRVSVEEKLGLLDRTLGSHVSPVLLRFLKVVCDHGRLDCLSAIQREARRQYNQARGIVQLQLVTAQPIAEEMVQNIREALQTKLAAQVDIEPLVDPTIIGGVLLRIGDKVYDGSVAQNLRLLREEAVANAAAKIRNAPEQFAVSG